MSNILQTIKNVLQESTDSTSKRVSLFFKTGTGDYAEHDQFLGITVPTLRKIAKKYQWIERDIIKDLLQSRYNEERLLALLILTSQYKSGNSSCQEEVYKFYLHNLNYVNNWNLVDSSAHLILGAHLFEKNCSFLEELAKSENLWERRIAIVSTWYFIRKNHTSTTFAISKILLQDKHDLIHKAVGWMLREAGKKDEEKSRDFLLKYAAQMPRTMLRYATEKFS